MLIYHLSSLPDPLFILLTQNCGVHSQRDGIGHDSEGFNGELISVCVCVCVCIVDSDGVERRLSCYFAASR